MSEKLHKAEADVAMLRAALAGLVGAESETDLRKIESAMRLIEAPEQDKILAINAIHALLSTTPVEG